MSVVSSFFSSRSPPIHINAQVASLMDSIFAIASGLALRVVIDAVGHQDNRLTGTLIGLWEGVVMQHFLKKMPKSYDPYVAYGVRLFVDFLFTESLSRLVLVLIWTGMGVILADIAPAIWVDAGLRRFWRRFRRDLYIITHSIPEVPLFSRPRTVRFTPSQATSVVSMVPPSVITMTTQDPSTRLTPPTPAPRKRAVPGAFPGSTSETETDIGSILGLRSPLSTSTSPGTAHHRLTSFPRRRATVETASEFSSGFNDLDEGNISSSSSSCSTDTPVVNPADIPDMEEEDVDTEREVLVDKGKGRENPEWESTPKQNPVVFPPTPSDSAFAAHYARHEPDEIQPPVADVPNIPDDDRDWENISRTEVMSMPAPPDAEGVPPPPPVKDVPHQPPKDSRRPLVVRPPKSRSKSSERALKLDTGSAPTPTTKKKAVEDLFYLGAPSTAKQPQPEISSSLPSQPAASLPSLQSTAGPERSLFDFTDDHRQPPPSYGQDQAQVLARIHQSPAFDFTKLTTQVGLDDNATAASHTAATANTTAAPVNNALLDLGNADNHVNTNANANVENPADNQDLLDNESHISDPQDSTPQDHNLQTSERVEPTTTTETGAPDAAAAVTTEAEVKAEAEAEPAPSSPISTIPDDPLPSNSNDRFLHAFDLRNQIIDLEREIKKLTYQRGGAIADGEDGADIAAERTISINNMTKRLNKLRRKAEMWFSAAGDDPVTELDVSTLPNLQVAIKIEDTLAQLLLKNEPTLVVSVGKGHPGKARKTMTLKALTKLDLDHNDNPENGRLIIVTLPTSKEP